jgi:hypothetical protein
MSLVTSTRASLPFGSEDAAEPAGEDASVPAASTDAPYVKAIELKAGGYGSYDGYAPPHPALSSGCCHPKNLYPNPCTVTMYSGFDGFASSF